VDLFPIKDTALGSAGPLLDVGSSLLDGFLLSGNVPQRYLPLQRREEIRRFFVGPQFVKRD